MNAQLLQVIAPVAHFRVGSLYAVGDEINGVRPVRPATQDNPTPNLGDPIRPPTYCDAAEVSAAFGLAYTPPAPRCGEQLDLFA